jgi:uncharacterized protein (TIGR02391 family)
VFFDDLHILRTIDRLERAELTGPLYAAINLLPEVTDNAPVYDDRDYRNFIRELEDAQRCGFIEFRIMRYGGDVAPPSPDAMGANNYLAQMVELRLTSIGRDRARLRVYEREPPDPSEDDGSPITQLVFQQIAEIVGRTYAPARLRLFLEDSSLPPDMIPALGDDPVGGLLALFSLFDGTASQRRALREFLGKWLSQALASGPNQDEEKELLAELARQGWHLRNERLVRGELVRRVTLAPFLGGDLLSNLHPQIQEAARGPFNDGHRAAAVLAALIAIEVRVRDLLGGTDRLGVALMGDAFDTDQPGLAINGLADADDRDEQRGFAFIFKGAMLGVRNPKAHGRWGELEERRALDYLGLASLLMRRLDDVEAIRDAVASDAATAGGPGT